MVKTANARLLARNIHSQLITDRQADVLEAVIKLTKKLGCSPTTREIAAECKIQLHAVTGHLRELRRKRYVTWAPRAGRSLVVLGGIPVLGEVG